MADCLGSGAEVKDALWERADFLIEQGLIERRGRREMIARNLLATPRGQKLVQDARGIAAGIGL